jgi:hypothetical protein
MKSSTVRLSVLLAVWAFLAAAFALSGAPRHATPFVIPALVAVLTVTFSWATARVSWLREAVESLGLRALLAFHLMRVVGGAFLWLQADGKLPAEFAQRAGWGDLLAAAGALMLLAGAGSRTRVYRLAFVAWNWLGLGDLALAVGTAAFLNRTHPGSMAMIVTFPWALVPLFFVPVLVANHLALLRRVGHADATAPVATV